MSRAHLSIRGAIRYLRRGLPVPLDVAAAVLAEGVDITELERQYGR